MRLLKLLPVVQLIAEPLLLQLVYQSSATASAVASTAMGRETLASGSLLYSYGVSTTAVAVFYSNGTASHLRVSCTQPQWVMRHQQVDNSSTATGYKTTASGASSIAMGKETTAGGDNSIAMGYLTSASGGSSIAMGRSTSASELYATAMGHETSASGNSSTATGYQTTASGICLYSNGKRYYS